MNGYRVLVVDDSRFTGDAISMALREDGFAVDVACDLWDLENADLKTPDLVLMDVVLQEAFGDDLAMLLRVSRGFTCPIVLMSSMPDEVLDQRCKDAELDGYIPKRLGIDGIVTKVRAVLGVAAQGTHRQAADTGFEAVARQRVRRIIHVAANKKHWNATAIAGEAHALAGEADLVASDLADAARECRDIAQRLEKVGSTPALEAALERLAKLVPGSSSLTGVLLTAASSPFYRDELVRPLDERGYALMEAQSLAELRPKLHAADYDLVLVEAALSEAEPGMLAEIRNATDAPVALLADGARPDSSIRVLVHAEGANRVLEGIRTLVRPRLA